MFREALADELAADADFQEHFAAAEPAILVSGTLQVGQRRRCAASHGNFGDRLPARRSGRWGRAGQRSRSPTTKSRSPSRSRANWASKRATTSCCGFPIARRDSGRQPARRERRDTSSSRQLKVAAVLPAEGLARFGLVPSQQLPRNVFVPLATLQELARASRARRMRFWWRRTTQASAADEAAQRALQAALRPQLEDYGLRVEQLTSPTTAVQISADQLVLAG